MHLRPSLVIELFAQVTLEVRGNSSAKNKQYSRANALIYVSNAGINGFVFILAFVNTQEETQNASFFFNDKQRLHAPLSPFLHFWRHVQVS